MAAPERVATPRHKVFGVGFHKTATTSLRDALRILGYRVDGPNFLRKDDIAETYVERCRDYSRRYDAFQDNPWPLVYREMDDLWPGAKFILTIRDVDAWLTSAIAHFSARKPTPMLRLIYGSDYDGVAGNGDRLASVYTRHNEEVRAYFADRPNDFLELDFTKASGWGPLCAFLGVEEPAVPLPHSNTAQDRERNQRQRGLLDRIKQRSKRISRSLN